jgi:cell division initiation protein
MPITIQAIEEKEFKTKVRGYDPVEVDEFLDEICDELIALQDENASLQEQLSQSRAQAARPNRPESAPVAMPPTTRPQVPTIAKEQEETLRKLLVNAQRVSDETVAEAHSRAEAIVAEAQKKAEEAVADIASEREALAQEVETLRKAASDYKERFTRLVEDQMHILKAETELFAD